MGISEVLVNSLTVFPLKLMGVLTLTSVGEELCQCWVLGNAIQYIKECILFETPKYLVHSSVDQKI